MLYQKYYSQVLKVLDTVMETQSENIVHAASLVADVYAGDGLLYVFGCGHSHIVGEDLFYRAGGFAPVYAMMDSPLMLHEGAVNSSRLERTSGLAKNVISQYPITAKDALMVVSTSGINPVPVEMALCAQEKGVPVIAITSAAYYNDVPRGGEKRLHECADVVIENGVCHGDASVAVGDSGIRTGPVSTLSSCMIAQCIMAQVAENLWERGLPLPIYVSGNLHGGMKKNDALVDRYRGRIQYL